MMRFFLSFFCVLFLSLECYGNIQVSPLSSKVEMRAPRLNYTIKNTSNKPAAVRLIVSEVLDISDEGQFQEGAESDEFIVTVSGFVLPLRSPLH